MKDAIYKIMGAVGSKNECDCEANRNLETSGTGQRDGSRDKRATLGEAEEFLLLQASTMWAAAVSLDGMCVLTIAGGIRVG